MDLQSLTKRALEVREKYSQLERKRDGKAWTNLNLMEGLVGDIGDLMKLVMAKEGIRSIEGVDEKLSHELVDCLWCILILASKYEINLGEEFLKSMDQLEKRIIEELE